MNIDNEEFYQMILAGISIKRISEHFGVNRDCIEKLYDQILDEKHSRKYVEIIEDHKHYESNAVQYSWPNVQKVNEEEIMGNYRLKPEWRLPYQK